MINTLFKTELEREFKILAHINYTKVMPCIGEEDLNFISKKYSLTMIDGDNEIWDPSKVLPAIGATAFHVLDQNASVPTIKFVFNSDNEKQKNDFFQSDTFHCMASLVIAEIL